MANSIKEYELIPSQIRAIAVREVSGTDSYGDVLATGNLVATLFYEIVTTQADYFGAGKVIGDVVTGLTTALDASNTVKQIFNVITLDNGNVINEPLYGAASATDMYLIETADGYGTDTAIETFMTSVAFAAKYQYLKA